jgi:hypothetical protein
MQKAQEEYLTSVHKKKHKTSKKSFKLLKNPEIK